VPLASGVWDSHENRFPPPPRMLRPDGGKENRDSSMTTYFRPYHESSVLYPYRRKPVTSHIPSWMQDQVRHGRKGAPDAGSGPAWEERSAGCRVRSGMGGKERRIPDQVRHGIVGCTACAEVNFRTSWCWLEARMGDSQERPDHRQYSECTKVFRAFLFEER
jgi:hypothetical protein